MMLVSMPIFWIFVGIIACSLLDILGRLGRLPGTAIVGLAIWALLEGLRG